MLYLSRPKPRWPLFLLLWVVVIVLYLPAWKGGFQRDFQGWLENFRDYSFADIINSRGFNFGSFYQLTQLELYGLTSAFGHRPLPWFLLFTALHALNSVLLYAFAGRLFEDIRLPHARLLALAGAVLFLISPNATEVVVWKASYHYLSGVAMILGILLLVQRWVHFPSRAVLAGILLLFAASTFSLEICYTTPWLVLSLVALLYWQGAIPADRFRKAVRWILLPLLLLFAGHLALHRAVSGVWVSHSAYVASGPATVPLLAGRVLSYEFHLLLFGRHFPGGARKQVYALAARPAVGYAVGALAVAVAAFLIARLARKRATPGFAAVAFMVTASFITLFIVLHYMVDDLFIVTNDRLLYTTSVFQSYLPVLLVAALAGQARLLRPALGALAVVFAGFTFYTVLQWRMATSLFYNLQYNYRWRTQSPVLLLNMPLMYRGIYLIASAPEEELNNHLAIFTPDSAKGTLYDVSSYNMMDPWDGAHVTVEDSLHLKITLNQWGTWWWYRTLGATDYENELYRVQMTDPGHEYHLELKSSPPGMVILYQQGDQWREVDIKKRGEQW